MFLPGFAILQALVPDLLDLGEKAIFAPIIGIAYSSLITLYLSVLKITINAYTIALSVLILSIPLLAYSYRKETLKISLKTKPSSYLILVVLLIIAVVFMSLPWSDNHIIFPMGDDPATSTFAATLIAEQEKIPQTWAPYFPEQNFTFSPGYPSVIASLFLLDSSMPMTVLVTFFLVFFALIHAQIFVLVRRISKDNRIALLAAAFTTMLSLSFYMMTIMGRFPALMGTALTLSLILFSFLFVTTGNRKLLLLTGITLASLFLTYTVSFLTATIFVLLFFGFNIAFYEKRKQTLLGLLALLIIGVGLALPWLASMFNRFSVEVPLKEAEALQVWFSGASVRAEFGLGNAMYYGYWILLFGILALLTVFVRRKSGSLLLAWFLSIFVLLLNEILVIHFPSWYYLQTGAFINPLMTFPLMVLAAYAFVKSYDTLKAKLHFSSRKYRRYISLVVVAIILVSAFSYGVSPILQRSLLGTNRISVADYNAMMWIAENTPKDTVIYNDHWVGTPSPWVPVLAHRQITMALLSISEVGWSNLMFTRQDESIIVAKDPNSTEALSILDKYNVSYIYLSNTASPQVRDWRNNYDPNLFLNSSHYELAFHEEDAWVIKVNY